MSATEAEQIVRNSSLRRVAVMQIPEAVMYLGYRVPLARLWSALYKLQNCLTGEGYQLSQLRKAIQTTVSRVDEAGRELDRFKIAWRGHHSDLTTAMRNWLYEDQRLINTGQAMGRSASRIIDRRKVQEGITKRLLPAALAGLRPASMRNGRRTRSAPGR